MSTELKRRLAKLIHSHSWWLAALAGGAGLTAWIANAPFPAGQTLVVIIMGGLSVAWLTVFPIPIGQDEANLSHAVTLSLALALTPQLASWSLLLGFLIGVGVRYLIRSRRQAAGYFADQIPAQAVAFGRQATGLSLAMALYRQLGGIPAIGWDAYSSILPAMYMGFAFSVLHLLLHWASHFALGIRLPQGRETAILVLSTVLSVPYALIGSASISSLGIPALIAIGTIVALISFVLHGHEYTAHGLVAFRRASVSLRDGLELESLLTTVHELVIELMDVPNIAIALHDPEEDLLRFPYAFREGRRYFWPNWPFAKVLSSHVIENGKPLLASRGAERTLRQLGDIGTADAPAAWLGVPLNNPKGTFGCLSIFHTHPGRALSYLDKEMLEKLAEPVSTAIDNALLLEKTKLRAQALASLHEIAATHDVDELVQNILARALSFTEAPRGNVALYEAEAEQLRIVSHWGYPTGSPIMDKRKTSSMERGIPARALRLGETIQLNDARLDPDFIDFSLGTTRGLLCGPIIHQGRRIGVITVESDSVGAFTGSHERVLIQLAAQSAIAITNANLVQELEARLREQSLLYQASAQLAASLDPEAVALAVADSLAVAISTDGAGISRFDSQNQTLHMLAAVADGRPIREPSLERIPLSTIPGLATCIERGQPIQWTIDDPPTQQDESYLADLRRARSVLALPLMAGDRVLGIIEAHSSQVRHFDQNEIRTAQTIASQAAIAVQNADLFLQIQESHDLLRTVLNASIDGILMFDTEGTIMVANNRLNELTRLERGSILGRKVTDPFLEINTELGYQVGELENLLAALNSNRPPDIGTSRIEIDAPGGATLLRSDTPVTDADGQFVGWLISLRDISEERKLEEDRRQLTEMIVHDLRSPLTTILGSLTLLEKTTKDMESPVTDQAIAIANLSCQQVLGLVNSLLDISGLESGDLTLSLAPVAIDEIARQLVSRYVQEANQHGILLDYQISSELPTIQADAEKIQRVLANLLDNALKFTPSGGQVDLSVTPQNSHVLISVRDTGPGVPEEFRERIFERFAQVPGAPGRRRGTGLGLAFSKLAVEAHGGKIWVEGNQDQGSRFCIRLPVDTQGENGEHLPKA